MTRPPPDATTGASAPRRGLLRRFYDWALHWAYTPYALPALNVISFAESSFFPIPPDVLLIPMCMGDQRRALRFATWCTASSVVGGVAGYYLGYFLWEAGLREIAYAWIPGFTPELFAKVSGWYGEYSFWIVFLAALTPIPYKVFTIAAGVCARDVHLLPFVLASVVGRGLRFFAEALLIRWLGPAVHRFLETRFELAATLFGLLLVGGFVAIKYLF